MSFVPILTALSYILISVGTFFVVTVTFGLMRFSNPYLIMHVTCLNDMVAVPLLLLGSALLFYCNIATWSGNKVILMIISIYVVVPISGYVMAKICYFIKMFHVK